MLVVSADDLGLTNSFNQGVQEAYAKGFVTSTSIRTNGSAFEDAIEQVLPQCPGIGVGLHLNIVEGPCQRDRITRSSKLCDASCRYKVSFGSLLQAYATQNSSTFDEIEDDYRYQIELALSKGLILDHLNSHQHSHAIPAIFEIVCRLAVEYSIPFVRLPKESFYLVRDVLFHLGIWYPTNIAKHIMLNKLSKKNASIAKDLGVLTNDYFVGIAYTGHMTRDTVINGLASLNRIGFPVDIAEVLLHPCKLLAGQKEVYVKPYLSGYVRSDARKAELATVLDGNLERSIRDEGWELTSYSRLANTEGSPGKMVEPLNTIAQPSD